MFDDRGLGGISIQPLATWSLDTKVAHVTIFYASKASFLVEARPSSVALSDARERKAKGEAAEGLKEPEPFGPWGAREHLAHCRRRCGELPWSDAKIP